MLAVRNPNSELASAERKRMWDHPFGHGHGGNSKAGAGHAHGPMMFDTDKAEQDAGYRLSLSVLGAHA